MSWNPVTFAQLMQQKAPGLVVLARVGAFEQLTLWTKTTGRSIVYEATVAQYTTVHSVRRVSSVRVSDPATLVSEPVYIDPSDTPTISQVQVARLVQRASIALVDANPGSFFHDLTAGRVYVSMTDSTSPDAKIIYIGFTLKFSTGGAGGRVEVVDDEGDVYFSYISALPQTTKGVSNAFFGVVQQGSGTLVLAAASGRLDESLDRYVWDLGDVTIYIGADSLPFSEFQALPQGRVQSSEWDEHSLALTVVDAANDLSVKFPREVFTAADATEKLVYFVGGVEGNAFLTRAPVDIEATAATTRIPIGQPKPVGYGRCENVTPVCVAVSATESAWRLTRHASFAIESVRVGSETVGSSGAGTTFLWFATPDLSSILIQSASGTDISSSTPSVTFSGKMTSDGEPMDNPADIVQDIVSVECALATEFDQVVLAKSRFLTNLYAFQMYFATESVLSAVLDDAMRSSLACFYLSNDGKYRYDVRAPSVADEQSLDEGFGDFVGFSRKSDGKRLYQTVFVEYSLNPGRSATADPAIQPGAGTQAARATGNYLRTSATRAESAALIFDRSVPFTVTGTYHASESGAFVLATRYARLCQSSEKRFPVTTRLRASLFDLMTKCTPTKARMPVADGKTPHLEVLKITREFAQFTIAVELGDQYVIGSQSFVAGATGLAWADATVDQRRTNGFFCNDDGYPDPDRPESWGTQRVY